MMRIQLIFIIAFAAMLQVSASSFGQKININQTNISLEKALKLIRSQSRYDVLYDANVTRKPVNVSLNVKDGSVTDALKQCLAGTGLTYELEEQTILIKEKSFVEEVLAKISQQLNEVEITGMVSAKDNDQGLPGATIMVKRTKRSVYSDVHGRYSIKALPTDTLVFSFMGYVTKYVGIGKVPSIYVKLEETTNALDAVVVQAYGKTTQRLTTGNIARVDSKQIEKQLLTNPIFALQGAVPGLMITAQDGHEMTNPKVELRGRSSINGNISSEPLYIIDGVPLTTLGMGKGTGKGPGSYVSRGLNETGVGGSISPLYTLNPADIESIEVLKDADATAIYGSRGGNGVILISTKKGKSGKPTLIANLNHGIKAVVGRWEMLNTEQYLEMRAESFKNDGIKPNLINAPELFKYDQHRYTDWQDYLWGGTGNWTDFNAGLSGGTDQISFRVSTGFNNTKDISAVSGKNQRLTFNSNLGYRSANQRLSFSLTTNYTYADNNVRYLSGSSIAMLPPNGPEILDEKGMLNFTGWQTSMSGFPETKHKSEAQLNGMMASLTLDYSLLKNLKLNLSMGYNSNTSFSETAIPLSSFNLVTNPGSQSAINTGTGVTKNMNIGSTVDYSVFIGKGKLTSLIGLTWEYAGVNSRRMNASGFASDEQLKSMNFATKFINSESESQYKYAGVFGSLNYAWDNKYIINLNGRRDGSSRFGPANRWGNFGSIGLAWIASDEPWIRKQLPKAISMVKFRGSYGILGSDRIGDYQYLSQWGSSTTSDPLLPYEGVNSAIPMIQPNDAFRWQRNDKREIGLNLAFFKDAITFDLVHYRNFTNNQLLAFPTPVYSGFGSVVLNSPAEVENSGVELMLGASVFRGKNFSWQMSFNWGKNTNKLIGYPRLEDSPYYATYRIGKSLETVYLFHFTGLDPQTGEYTYQDLNGDGKIFQSFDVPAGTGQDDRGVAINTAPDYSGGMSHTFQFKNFELYADFYYVKQDKAFNPTGNGNGNVSLYLYENSWRKPGDQALYSKFTNLTKSSGGYLAASDALYQKADFIRLKNVRLSWRLPAARLKSLGIGSLAVNVAASNIFVITNFKGLDPEILSFGLMPPSRIMTMGLNCSF